MTSQSPQGAVGALEAKLSSHSRHVCVLVGAGAPKAVGLPDLRELQERVIAGLNSADKELVVPLFKEKNLEEVLTHLRLLKTLLRSGQDLEGLDSKRAADLDEEICASITAQVSADVPSLEPFVRFASWLARGNYNKAIEVFSINYDTLIERGLETVGAPYFDGFVGNIDARFRADLVDGGLASVALPSGWARLWKLHGSINWLYEGNGDITQVVRSARASSGRNVAIYPSSEKYEESRRVPFVVLFDRFRRALSEPETVLLTTGYSFGDEHINEVIFDAAMRHPRSEAIAFCHSGIPVVLGKQAARTPNISVYAPKKFISSGADAEWVESSEINGIWKDGAFLLGDFVHLATFLGGKPAWTDPKEP